MNFEIRKRFPASRLAGHVGGGRALNAEVVSAQRLCCQFPDDFPTAETQTHTLTNTACDGAERSVCGWARGKTSSEEVLVDKSWGEGRGGWARSDEKRDKEEVKMRDENGTGRGGMWRSAAGEIRVNADIEGNTGRVREVWGETCMSPSERRRKRRRRRCRCRRTIRGDQDTTVCVSAHLPPNEF